MIAALFFWLGVALSVASWVAVFTRAPVRRVYGLFTIADGAFLVAEALRGERLTGCFVAACGAYMAWCWWNSGGGGGTKRRLRALARRFRGVRRTAPAAGSA